MVQCDYFGSKLAGQPSGLCTTYWTGKNQRVGKGWTRGRSCLNNQVGYLRQLWKPTALEIFWKVILMKMPIDGNMEAKLAIHLI